MTMTTQQICDYYGYPLENHEVHTSDGYILDLMRIPYGPDGSDPSERPPILLIHSSAHNGGFFLFHGAEDSPGFYLSNQGYDVWLFNMRGTTPSMDHDTLNWQRDHEYWDYTWSEAYNDHMASIQYIIDNTSNLTF